MTNGLRVEVADLHRAPWPPIAWLQRHPVVVDIAVVLIACVPHLLALLFRSGEVGWWGYPLLAVAAAALLLRRRWPFAMLVVVAIACAASPLAQPGFGFPMIPFAFALYTVAALQSTTRAVLGYGVGLVCTVLATIPYSLSGTTPPLVGLLDPFALIALVVGLLVRGRRERRAALSELVNERIENAAASERARIAAEMHDSVAHSISVMVALANGADAGWTAHPERARAAVGKIPVVGREALVDIHRVLKLLRDADAGLDRDLHESGLNLPALDDLVTTFRDAGLAVALVRRGGEPPEALRPAVYRIVQESLTNALRHATGATLATVTVTTADDGVVIEVVDDGAAAGPALGSSPGHGLTGIGERARGHGGESTAGPLPSGGWRTSATLRIGDGDG